MSHETESCIGANPIHEERCVIFGPNVVEHASIKCCASGPASREMRAMSWHSVPEFSDRPRAYHCHTRPSHASGQTLSTRRGVSFLDPMLSSMLPSNAAHQVLLRGRCEPCLGTVCRSSLTVQEHTIVTRDRVMRRDKPYPRGEVCHFLTQCYRACFHEMLRMRSCFRGDASHVLAQCAGVL